jgi:multiple sugar transport system substrate-binding protein
MFSHQRTRIGRGRGRAALSTLSLVLILALLACAPTPAAAPTTAPPAAQPAATTAPAPTQASAPTQPPPPPTQPPAATATTAAPVAAATPVPPTPTFPVPATPLPGKKVITWWSHWANEPLKRQVIETIVKDYEAAHPDVDIILTWWDAPQLSVAVRAALTAGQGAPDISTDVDLQRNVEAGWVMDLESALPFDKFVDGVKGAGTFPSVKGVYNFQIGFQALGILYNPQIFDKLGIKVPANFQFTQDEFVDVVKKCSAGGYAGVADAAGNRNYPALFPIWGALTQMVGRQEQADYDNGMRSWDTPEMRQVLNWLDQLRLAGMWPKTFATMTIDEFHVYFHTQQKSCMLYVPSWYTGRAFKPVADGGQDSNVHFGMLRYPLMKGTPKFNNTMWAAFESGYMILKGTKNPDLAKDVLVFAAQPKYGALWAALTLIPSAIKYDPVKDWPKDLKDGNQWQWWWDELNKVYGGMERAVGPGVSCGDFIDARTAAINEGLPQGLLTVDQAIQKVNAKLCKK